jgi:hypothetical protein
VTGMEKDLGFFAALLNDTKSERDILSRGLSSELGVQGASFSTLRALLRRKFGQTLSLKGTDCRFLNLCGRARPCTE